MRADIFVDPDYIYDSTSGAYNSQSYENYLAELVERWNSSEGTPILIRGNIGWKRFWERIEKKGEIFNAASYHSLIGGGEVSKQDWESFGNSIRNRALEIRSDIRIHGAIYQGCLVNFAVQLYGFFIGERFMKERTGPNTGTISEMERILSLEKEGAFCNSGIRFGTVMKSSLYELKVEPDEDFPFGRTPYQFTDKETKIVEADLSAFTPGEIEMFRITALCEGRVRK